MTLVRFRSAASLVPVAAASGICLWVASNARREMQAFYADNPHCPEVFSSDAAPCFDIDPIATRFLLSAGAAAVLIGTTTLAVLARFMKK